MADPKRTANPKTEQPSADESTTQDVNVLDELRDKRNEAAAAGDAAATAHLDNLIREAEARRNA